MAKKIETKENFQEELLGDREHLNIGMVGHVDSGKTTTTSAITKVQNEKGLARFRKYEQIDSSPDEQQRGVTITAAHVEIATKNRHYSLIDCPGHEDYIRNMIRGSAQMAGAVVVISASEGVEKQTEEHLQIIGRSDVKHIVVFVNEKSEAGSRLSDEDKEMLEIDIRPCLERHGYDTADKKTVIIFGSSLKALNPQNKFSQEEENREKKNIELLIKAIDEQIPTPVRQMDKDFLMYIEGKHSIPGHGVVVTGTVIEGVVKEGDKLILTGFKDKSGSIFRKEVVVKGVQMFGKNISQGKPGDDIGLNLRNVLYNELHRGQALGKDIESYSVFEAHAELDEKGIKVGEEDKKDKKENFATGYQPQFYCGTASVTGKVVLPEGAQVQRGKGNIVTFTVELSQPIFMRVGSRFFMREGRANVGKGVVVSLKEQRDSRKG